MQKEKLSYRETARRFDVSSDTRIRDWERIYLTEGPGLINVPVRAVPSSYKRWKKIFWQKSSGCERRMNT